MLALGGSEGTEGLLGVLGLGGLGRTLQTLAFSQPLSHETVVTSHNATGRASPLIHGNAKSISAVCPRRFGPQARRLLSISLVS